MLLCHLLEITQKLKINVHQVTKPEILNINRLNAAKWQPHVLIIPANTEISRLLVTSNRTTFN
jgi:hypothetical protein